MTTESLTINSLSRSTDSLALIVSFFTTDTAIEEVTTVQPKIEDHQLLQMLSNPKRIKDLIFVWKSDEHGQIHGS